MRKSVIGLVAVVAYSFVTSCADEQPVQLSAAQELINRSIAFHDPNSIWSSETLRIDWFGTGTDGEERSNVLLTLHPDQSKFELTGRYRGSAIEYEADGDSWAATVNGTDQLTPEVMEEMRLHREDGMFWRSYYGFLAGLPMKLHDPGTRIDPTPIAAEFNGMQVTSVRVEYDAEVGSDTWYFYFDPTTAQLVGCRFYHDETANDGEYITMEDLTEAGGLRIPRHRRWYVNADDRFLGSDEVRAIEVL